MGGQETPRSLSQSGAGMKRPRDEDEGDTTGLRSPPKKKQQCTLVMMSSRSAEPVVAPEHQPKNTPDYLPHTPPMTPHQHHDSDDESLSDVEADEEELEYITLDDMDMMNEYYSTVEGSVSEESVLHALGVVSDKDDGETGHADDVSRDEPSVHQLLSRGQQLMAMGMAPDDFEEAGFIQSEHFNLQWPLWEEYAAALGDKSSDEEDL